MSSFKSSLARPSKSGGLVSIERVVAVLTPVFSAAAGLLTTVVGRAVPGANLSKTDVTALFITGATTGGVAALKWLHGRSRFVELEANLKAALERMEKSAHPLVTSEAGQDLLAELKSHPDEIIKQLGDKLGASASAEQIAEQIVQKMWRGAATSASGGSSGSPPAAGGTAQAAGGQAAS